MTMSIYVPLQQEDLDDEYPNQKVDKEAQYSGDADEMVSQPQRGKGGLITMPFIIGMLSIYQF